MAMPVHDRDRDAPTWVLQAHQLKPRALESQTLAMDGYGTVYIVDVNNVDALVNFCVCLFMWTDPACAAPLGCS